MKKLPIGIQNIGKILKNNKYLYVDKTGFINKLIEEGSPHYFCSRPRRFGKSLFLDTLKMIFEGDKDLFKGCAIYENKKYEWKKYPVVLFDFYQVENTSPKEFKSSLLRTMKDIAKEFGLSIETPSIEEGLKHLIISLSKKKQEKVVVLVDEYDRPIIDHLNNTEIAKGNRYILKSLFGTLKSLDEHLQFSFVTGVSKFSQVSLFSGPNNLRDITMNPEYAGMMGYTEEEIRECFTQHIQAVVNQRNQGEKVVTDEEVLNEIREWYNGYRFSESEVCVYNPFSTLNFMEDKKAKAYWYSSGTPSFLIDQVKKHPKSMVSLDGTTATEEELMDISSLEEIDLKALMYQTGYFTVKGYNPISSRYYLGIPNKEVRTSFFNSLIKNFTPMDDLKSSEKFLKALENHQVESIFEHIGLGFASFAYQVFSGAKERTYQGMLLSILYGMGFDPVSERSTNTGRIDVVLDMQKTTYILELKLDGSVDKALEQIHKKKYFEPYTHKRKEIVIIGANFSSDMRNIADWKGELLSEAGEFIKKIHRGSIRK